MRAATVCTLLLFFIVLAVAVPITDVLPLALASEEAETHTEELQPMSPFITLDDVSEMLAAAPLQYAIELLRLFSDTAGPPTTLPQQTH
jgi:hypothetical protein